VAVFRRWWQRLREARQQRHFRRVVALSDAGELPAALDRGTIYQLGRERPKWAVFDCPCRDGHRITLSLQRSHERRWQLSAGHGGPSIFPSVELTAPPFCHYLVRDGRISWVHDLRPAHTDQGLAGL
jgi:hypothetical protein